MELKQISTLEMTRLKNIADNKAMLATLMADLEKLGGCPTKPQRKKKVSRSRTNDLVMRRNPERRARFNPIGEPPMTRLRKRQGSVSSQSSLSSASSSPNKDSRLVVKFGAFCKPKTSTTGSGSDSDSFHEHEWEELPAKKRAVPRRYHEIKTPEEITEHDLDMVAVQVSDKMYDAVLGTSCHQCRQKTFDQKTICRSEECQGIRGQFCGPCLRNRYGENVKEALKDPEWECPPCRGICNCSICRRRSGKCSTGILIHSAKDNGFNDVNTYLKSLRA